MSRIIGTITISQTCQCTLCEKTMDADCFVRHMLIRHPWQVIRKVVERIMKKGGKND